MWHVRPRKIDEGDGHDRNEHRAKTYTPDEQYGSEVPDAGVRVREREGDSGDRDEKEAGDGDRARPEPFDKSTSKEPGEEGSDALRDHQQSRIQYGISAKNLEEQRKQERAGEERRAQKDEHRRG